MNSLINIVRSYRLRASLLAVALLAGVFVPYSSTAYAGKDCSGGFTITLSDGRVLSGDQDSVIAVGASRTAQVTGRFVSFTVDVNTFTVTNYTLNSDITANRPTVIFARKELLHGKLLSGNLSIDINNEQVVLQRSGAGQDMKIQAKDCSEGGIFQMEPEPSAEVLHQLGTGLAYCVDSLGRVLIVSGASPFVGRESPENATLVSPSPLGAIVGANTSRWLIQSGGRMGMVTGEDAVEPLGAPCSTATTATPTPSPTPGATPGAIPSPTPFASPTPSASPSPSPTPSASPTPTPSPSASPTPSPTPGATPNPSPTPGATPSPSPTPGATPNPSPTPGATPNPSPTPSATPSPTPSADVRIRAELVGATFNGQTPRAEVEYRDEAGERRLEIEVENVNLPAGTILTVVVDNVQIGIIQLEGGGKGELRLRTDDGQTVPQVNSRSRVVIATQGGTTLVAGAFAPTFTPNPNPTPVNGEIRIEARLAGASINGLTPKGKAKWRARDEGRLKFNVEVEKVNLPVGTRLNVLVDGVKVGELVITTLLEHELELDTNRGQFVPQVHDSTRVVVTNQAGTTILSGTFNTFVAPIAGNDIDNSNLFVQQQYLDFFDREADDSGLQFWTSQIASCGSDAACIEGRRINTSGAFFLSIEFQNTGYLLYRLHKASFGTMPRRADFLVDMQALGQGVVVNQPGWEARLEANRRALVERWVSRQSFTSVFAGMSNAQFVDALFQRAGVTPDPQQRLSLINGLDAGTETRATVLHRVAENQTFYRKEYNPAFVLMQYFGYLHRNPDEGQDGDMSGFHFWLNKLDEFGGDFHKAEMVKAFIEAGEYRNRFQW